MCPDSPLQCTSSLLSEKAFSDLLTHTDTKTIHCLFFFIYVSFFNVDLLFPHHLVVACWELHILINIGELYIGNYEPNTTETFIFVSEPFTHAQGIWIFKKNDNDGHSDNDSMQRFFLV